MQKGSKKAKKDKSCFPDGHLYGQNLNRFQNEKSTTLFGLVHLKA